MSSPSPRKNTGSGGKMSSLLSKLSGKGGDKKKDDEKKKGKEKKVPETFAVPDRIIYHKDHGGAWLCPTCKIQPGDIVYARDNGGLTPPTGGRGRGQQPLTQAGSGPGGGQGQQPTQAGIGRGRGQQPLTPNTPTQTGAPLTRVPTRPATMEQVDALSWSARGYTPPPTNLPSSIPGAYGGTTPNAIGNNYYFLNPAGVEKCQNAWRHGFDGPPCPFTRAGIEGRIPEQEIEDGWKNSNDFPFFCPKCAAPEVVVGPNPNSYMLNRPWRDYMKEKGYVRRGVGRQATNWQLAEALYARRFEYDGTPESLKCKTRKFGKGGNAGEHCNGRYGDELVFYLESAYKKRWKPWDRDEQGLPRLTRYNR